RPQLGRVERDRDLVLANRDVRVLDDGVQNICAHFGVVIPIARIVAKSREHELVRTATQSGLCARKKRRCGEARGANSELAKEGASMHGSRIVAAVAGQRQSRGRAPCSVSRLLCPHTWDSWTLH